MTLKKGLSLFLAVTIAGTVFLAGCAKTATPTTQTTSKNSTATQQTGAATTTSDGTGNTNNATDDSWTKVQAAKTLVLGLDDAFPPMGFRDENNEIVGFDIDLAKEVTKRLGIELKLQPIDWEAKILELNSGTIDCIWNGLTITPDRSKEVNFTLPYMQNRQVVIVRGDSDIQTLADLAGKTVCLQAASSAADALAANVDFKDSLGDVVELSDNVTAFMDLEAKTSDAVLMDEIVAAYYIKQNNKDFRILDEALADEEYGVGFRKQDQALRDQVNAQLQAMAADGTLAQISNKWFGRDVTTIK